MADLVSFREAAAVFGVSVHMFREYVRRGLAPDSLPPAPGRRYRAYSLPALRKAAAALAKARSPGRLLDARQAATLLGFRTVSTLDYWCARIPGLLSPAKRATLSCSRKRLYRRADVLAARKVVWGLSAARAKPSDAPDPGPGPRSMRGAAAYLGLPYHKVVSARHRLFPGAVAGPFQHSFTPRQLRLAWATLRNTRYI